MIVRNIPGKAPTQGVLRPDKSDIFKAVKRQILRGRRAGIGEQSLHSKNEGAECEIK